MPRTSLETLALAALVISASSASAASVDRTSPHYSTTALELRKVLPGRGVEMPATLYPREELEARWAKQNDDPQLRKKAAKARGRAAKYLRIPDAQWVEMIPDRSTSPRYAKGGGMHTAYLDGSGLAFPTLGIELTHEVDKFRGFLKSGYRVAENVDLVKLGVTHGTPFVLFPNTKGARLRIAGEVLSRKLKE